MQGHTANSNRAENPVHLLVTMLQRIISKPLDEGSKYFQSSSIQIPSFNVENSAANVIPEIAKATINIRFNDLHTGESLIKWLNEHISKTFDDIPKASCSFTTDQTGECFMTKPGKFHNLIEEAVKDEFLRNSDLEMGTDGGTSDARFIKNYCEVLELGSINNSLHQIDENVNISDLENLHNLYLKILEKYFQKD